MLGKNISIINHQRNIQVLMTQLFKIMNNLACSIMRNMFTPCVNNSYLKKFQEFVIERNKTVKCCLETVSFRCTQIWALVPDTIKYSIFIDRV